MFLFILSKIVGTKVGDVLHFLGLLPSKERAQRVEEKEEPVEERKIHFAPLNRLFSAHLTFPSHHAVCHAPFKIAWQFSPMRLLRFLDLKLSLISWIKAVRLSLFKFTFFWSGIKYFKFSPLFLSTVYTSRKVQPTRNYNRGSTLSSNVMVANNFCFLSQVVGSMPLKVMVAEPKFRKGWGKKTAMWLSRLFIHNTVFRNKRQLPKETGVLCHLLSLLNLKLQAEKFILVHGNKVLVCKIPTAMCCLRVPLLKLQIADAILLPLISTENDFDVTKQCATIWVFFQ